MVGAVLYPPLKTVVDRRLISGWALVRKSVLALFQWVTYVGLKTLISPENLSYASTCQTIGLNTGLFASFTVFLAFNSEVFAWVSYFFFETSLWSRGQTKVGNTPPPFKYILVLLGRCLLRGDLMANYIWERGTSQQMRNGASYWSYLLTVQGAAKRDRNEHKVRV